ncbi:cysteine desulfurase [Rhodanobacter glycinis]|uniref:cysteine desulfurase n=1 Tax=Rhodanobacter glycinis TaxID=582702 RepID=A0A5B9E1W6_9GAMM|nr:cysteine desulfurase family protein [Rhodanobacter glycinis]QEE24965.1 cysteine desulfurase [Rhodanobacter glycinis]
MSDGRPIYLDHNATTPLDPTVFEAMRPYFLEHFGNPSSVEHIYGLTAATAVERAREQVARAINADAGEIVFTGSCTEADNLAILGVARAAKASSHFITSQIEHPAVLEAFRQLEKEGHAVTYLSVDEVAQIRLEELEATFRPNTLLVSIMGGNNEVGTLQPLADIGRLCSSKGVLFHSDLAQLPAYVAIDVKKMGLHLASFSAHKAYGPKGVGALYVRRQRPRIKLEPLLWGGGHERALRPGTLNTPLIVGMGEAMELSRRDLAMTRELVSANRDRLKNQLIATIDGAQLNGHPTERLPNNLSLSITGVEPLALMRLIRNEIAFSASSACATHEVRTSHVLLAMFGECPRARGAFRLSPGRFTTTEQVDEAMVAITMGINRLRSIH